MDHFIFTYHSQERLLNTRIRAAHQRFSADKQLSEYRGETFWLNLESFENHFFAEVSNDVGTVLCGRENIDQIRKSASFPYFLLHFDLKQGWAEVSTDRFGLFPYFFSSYEGQLIVTNYLPAIMHFWGEDLEVDDSAKVELLYCGTITHGKTLFKNIFMSHPLYDLQIKNFSQVQRVRKAAYRVTNSEAPVDAFYAEMTKSVAEIIKTSSIRWITLTGGADSRLIFSTLNEKMRKSSTFLFDDVAADPQHISFDQLVVSSLQEMFSLNFQYGFPRVDAEKLKSHIGSQSGSAHNFILTGLYGGEIVGGQALNVQPHQMRTFDVQEEEKVKFREYVSAESDLFYCVSLMTSSFMSFFYNDKNWIFPYVITQKKITPFLNTKILEIIFSQDEEYIRTFSFYKKVYRDHAPVLMQIPFHSQISRTKDRDDDFVDIMRSTNREVVRERNVSTADILVQRNIMLDHALKQLNTETAFYAGINKLLT